ncbi:DNA double-strand break repair nuclease NurA [Candidatus Dependentiae bacterium]|nr:DNA double-strand break repair nuclease NurA [Candidatus Dependentiae bacterium]MBU4387628.1 DNA double-strand break repair nuclease NurA [Candidatus Dependentiae bacterium]MCG2756459.1 DNA double-strand break repair nuclease NurA [Candidatus Dependentiae bacterium]
MLNKNSLLIEFKKVSEKLFPNLAYESDIAQKTWDKISNQDNFKEKVELSKSSFLLPFWQNNLAEIFNVNKIETDYSVIAIDGSQIYPDRNISGAGCFLINIGGCSIKYSDKSEVKFYSEPKLFLTQELIDQNEKISFSQDLVDFKREELELLRLLEISVENNIDLSLVDGTVIFWPLEGKTDEVKNYFLNLYINILNKFYEQNKLIAGVISFPKSRELVNLIKLGLCRFDYAECISCHRIYNDFPCKIVDSLIDSQVTKFFLPKNYRSTIFFSKSKIVDSYPEHLKPCFFYLNTEKEIIRVETFSWIANDRSKLDFIASIALDQVEKGMGYPVVLAQAHEAAVVKGPDREFFYYLLQRQAMEQNKRIFYSQKSLKKKGIAI